MSPAMAAAAAVAGALADVRQYPYLGTEEEDPRTPSNAKQSNAFATKSYTNPGPSIKPTPPYMERDSTSNADTESAAAAPGLPKFTKLTGTAAPLDIQNVDTDMIIPKEFLKTIQRAGLGFAAFAELRYDNPEEVAIMGEEVAKPKSSFILNQPGYEDTKILIAGDNFGCGSSREHAPWSINDLGIACIISTSFADIFYNNCFNNGMLPLTLDRSQIDLLVQDSSVPGNQVTVDLENQVVVRPNGEQIAFEIDDFRKHCLLNGLDKIGLTLAKEDLISTFESSRSRLYPWLDGASLTVPDNIPMYPNAEFWKTNEVEA